MNARLVSILAVAAAVVAAAVAAVCVSINRTEMARQLREAAASKEATADANRKAEAKKADAEAEKRRAAEIALEAKKAEAAKTKEETLQAKAEEKAAEEMRKAKEAEWATAEAQATAAQAARDEARAKEKTALAAKEKAVKEAEAAALRAQEAADTLAAEKLRSEKVVAESKLLEQRQIDFAEWQRNLTEFERDLKEREAALQPEKTIANLAWAGGVEDSVIDENGNVTKQARVNYDPEKDRTIPRTSRALARQERLAREASDKEATRVREKIVATLESLYVRALKEDDVVHAQYYRESLKSLYPDWEFKGETTK